MSYVIVDLESDGPIPAEFSMVCFGAVIFDDQLDRSFCGSLRFFRIGLALGGRFPLAHSPPHKGRAVGFSHITAFDKQLEYADISAIVIQLKLPALESIE